MWNQFVFAGANLPIVTSIIKSIAQKLKKHNLDVILTIPPSRGYLMLFLNIYIMYKFNFFTYLNLLLVRKLNYFQRNSLINYHHM